MTESGERLFIARYACFARDKQLNKYNSELIIHRGECSLSERVAFSFFVCCIQKRDYLLPRGASGTQIA
jgi:hypothetical protein